MKQKNISLLIGIITAVILSTFFFHCKKGVSVTSGTDNDGPLRIVQWSDPQLGWRYVKYKTNIAQSERVVQLINEIAPDVLLITGDMVHDPDSDKQINDFLKIIKRVNVPMLLTPGNHDLSNPVTTEGLQRYRSLFGDDLQTIEIKGYSIIAANSSLLYYQENVPQEEYQKHFARVNKALQKAQKKKHPIIMMTHIPPFDYVNPEFYRLFVEKGTFLWVSGHWHCPYKQVYDYLFGSFTMLVGEASSLNMWDYPIGIRLLTIFPDNTFEWEYIPL